MIALLWEAPIRGSIHLDGFSIGECLTEKSSPHQVLGMEEYS